MPTKTSRTQLEKAVLAIIALTAIFAFMNVIARFLSTDFTFFQQVYLRISAAFLLTIVLFHKHIRWHVFRRVQWKEWLLIALRGLALYTGCVAMLSYAVEFTSISNITFLGALPFVSLLGFLFLGEKVRWWKILFIASSVLGVMLIAVRNGSVLDWNQGDALVVLATLLFALSSVARKWQSDTLNNYELTLGMFAFGSLSTVIASLSIGELAPLAGWSLPLVGALLAGGILNVATVVLINYSFSVIDAVRAGNLFTLESAFGLLFGFVFYQEIPDWRGLLGGTIIIGSVIAMNTFSAREQAKTNPAASL